jgi:hypothetical protein
MLGVVSRSDQAEAQAGDAGDALARCAGDGMVQGILGHESISFPNRAQAEPGRWLDLLDQRWWQTARRVS